MLIYWRSSSCSVPRSGVSPSVTHILASKQRSDLHSLTNVPFRIDESFVKVSFHGFYIQFPEWKKIIVACGSCNVTTLIFPLLSYFLLYFSLPSLSFPSPSPLFLFFFLIFFFLSSSSSLYSFFLSLPKSRKKEKTNIEYKYIKN